MNVKGSSGSRRYPLIGGMCCLLSLVLQTALAASAADEIAIPTSPLEDGGYVEAGLGVSVIRRQSERENPADNGDVEFRVSPLLGGAWRRGRLFLEAHVSDVNGLRLGVTLWNDQTRVVDLVAASLPGTIGTPDNFLEETDDADRKVLRRNNLFGASGLRFRQFFGQNLLQLSALVDWQHGNGVLSSLFIGRQWQFGNWNAEGTLGLRHASQALADFVVGVDEDEATQRF